MFSNLSLRAKIMRRLGPTRILALSFLFVILLGAFLLWLPFTDKGSTSLSFLDSLFIATSATCVTGLVPVALSEQYNILGHTVILFLMQIGGLGVMSLIAFAITAMKHRLYHSERRMIQDALNKDDMVDIPKFLKSILKYTFIFEGIGAFLFSLRFVPEYGWFQGIYNSIFLAVSAFCNAGMDNFSPISLAVYVHDPLINFTVAGLIITGGLGFAVWFDLRKKLPAWIKHKQPFKKVMHSLSVHTKVVLLITGILIVSGATLVFAIEYGNPATFGPLSLYDKVQAAFFQSVTLRTAGFSTIDFAQLKDASLMFMLLYMLIGGSPGGTAGGIKTTAVAMMFLILRAQLKGEEHITLFKRTISSSTFNRAFVVTIAYVSALFIAIFILTLTEDNIGFLPLSFEAFSAIATVGLSAGVTPLLSDIGKFIIILLMFIGRVGPITIVISMFKFKGKHKSSEVVYPQGDVLIG